MNFHFVSGNRIVGL